MIHSELARQVLLVLVGLVFGILAIRTLMTPERVAAELGYSLQGPNGYSELHAVYVGIWLATSAIAGLAAFSVEQAHLGDTVAVLVLAQPVGRLLAIPRHGFPSGPMRVMFALEAVGGVALFSVRGAV